jgi:hypothetical protein
MPVLPALGCLMENVAQQIDSATSPGGDRIPVDRLNADSGTL